MLLQARFCPLAGPGQARRHATISTRPCALPGYLRSRTASAARHLIVLAAAAEAAPFSASDKLFADDDVEDNTSAFPYPLPLDPQQRVLSALPLVAFYPALLLFVAGSAAVGNVIGRALPVEEEHQDLAGYGVAAVVGAGAVAASVLAKQKRDSAAVVDLYNEIVQLPDPSELTPSVVQRVGGKYGISMQKEQLDGLKKIYGQFIEKLIPTGDAQLKGDEGDKIRAFKESLELSDEDAAPVHIEVGRRLSRDSFETKDRNQQFEKRKAFQRLIYVSQLVFGDQKAAFLLPWRRTFNLTDSQLFVARRDNAKAVFRRYMESQGGALVAERHFLHELRKQQHAVKLMDESAEEIVKEYARKHIEAQMQKAVDALKATGKSNKDLNAVVQAVRHIADYSRKLQKLANEEDLIPGLGVVTLAGGPFAMEGRTREVRDVFRAYLDECITSEKQVTPELEAEVRELQVVFGLSAKEANAVQTEVAARLYRRLLKEEVISGRLDAAPSPASVLQDLCDKVRFSPEAAVELHKALYKQKLVGLMEKGRNISDADAEDLKRIRRILCIPADVAKKAQRETAGKALEEVLSDIFMMGAKPVSDFEMSRLDLLIKGLRIDSDVAIDILKQATRERFRAYVTAAQKERDRKDFAAGMKKLLQFNALVVTPLLQKLKGFDAAAAELAELLLKAQQMSGEEKPPGTIDVEAQAINSEGNVTAVRKALQAQRGEFDEDEKKAQREITLKDDLSAQARGELYKNYLMYSMSADSVDLPVGGMIRKKSSQQVRAAEMGRLNTLAELLGMSGAEVAGVQGEMAEQAYKMQATDIMRSGPLDEEKRTYLEDMRAQLGLSKEATDKLLKAVQTEVYGSSAALEDGKWTIDRIMQVVAGGGTIEGQVEEVTRRNLFRKELQRRITDGRGELNADFILKTLPSALALPEKSTKQIIKEEVASRKRMLLVQAVSQYRQKRLNDSATSLNNLLSCVRVLPDAEPMPWSERQELKDVFRSYCSKEDDVSKRALAQKTLGLTDAEAVELQSTTGASAEAAHKALDDDAAFL